MENRQTKQQKENGSPDWLARGSFEILAHPLLPRALRLFDYETI